MPRRNPNTLQAIALKLGLPRSTVGVILRRIGLGRLAALDPWTKLKNLFGNHIP